MGRPLKIAKAQALITITDTFAANNRVRVSGANTLTDNGVIAGMPFITANATFGGITANTTYYVLQVTSANTFTVSATQLSANPNYTPVTLTNTSLQSAPTTVGLVDSGFNNPSGSGNTYSVVGGDTSLYGRQVSANVAISRTGNGTITANTASVVLLGTGTNFNTQLSVGSAIQTTNGVFVGYIANIGNAVHANLTASSLANVTAQTYVYADDEAGYIVRQKGKQKYLVKGTTSNLVSQCYMANLTNANLRPGTMTVVGTYANAATVRIQSLSDHTAELFTATSGPIATGSIVLQNANPAFTTFNTAAAANAAAGQPYPLVQVESTFN